MYVVFFWTDTFDDGWILPISQFCCVQTFIKRNVLQSENSCQNESVRSQSVFVHAPLQSSFTEVFRVSTCFTLPGTAQHVFGWEGLGVLSIEAKGLRWFITVFSGLYPSSETQGLLAGTMRYIWAKVYFKS